MHDETRHLLQAQEATNRQLEDANGTLAAQRGEKLTVTLNSIGDAVIATDLQARVTLLNPLAQRLTGWTRGTSRASRWPTSSNCQQGHAQGRGDPGHGDPGQGTVQGLANHTVLIARDGRESDIADSCAPIRDAHDQVIGAVLVFRDVTREYEARHALGQQKIELEMQNQELRHSQAALDLARARYFDLYDLAPVGCAP
ncbi:MAG: PAS domain-containing protein [Comamonadaceae bacterium]|nr:PAS domain-containing protein [Comamonadaceae bacterium]